MTKDRFPDWNDIYKQDVSTMPWYNEKLDSDLEHEIKQRKITKGKFLDLGTGPGTQAIQLTKVGFTVTGTDLSVNAKKGKKTRWNNKFSSRRYSGFKTRKK